MKNMKQIQHGDVLIREISRIPKGASIVARRNGLLLVAEGEATGHNHVITSDKAMLYELKGDLYLSVDADEVTITQL